MVRNCWNLLITDAHIEASMVGMKAKVTEVILEFFASVGLR